MTHSQYRYQINLRIDQINETLGTSYYTEYCKWYGGWDFMQDYKTAKYQHDYLRLVGRLESKAMLAYLEGICMTLQHIQRNAIELFAF